MLYPCKSALTLDFRCLPKCAEGTVQNSPGCSFELLISEGREPCQAICCFVSGDMVSAVRQYLFGVWGRGYNFLLTYFAVVIPGEQLCRADR